MKKILAIVLCLVMVFAMAAVASADDAAEWNVVRPEGLPEGYPEKEITFIYCFGAGSPNDTTVRILGAKIKEMEGWKNGIVIEYDEGASGDIGWSKFMEKDADGYTLCFAPTAEMITALHLGRNYTPDNLAYVFNMMSDPGAIGVAADSEYNTLAELMDACKDKTLSFGVTSVNGSEGLAMKQLMEAAGVSVNMVAFESEAEILTAVANDDCDAFCLNVGDCTTFIEEGSIKLLAVGSEKRSEFYPDIPTYQEAGFDVVQCNSRAISAPAGTDEAIVKYLSDCFMAAANSPDVAEQLDKMQIPKDFMDCETAQTTFLGYYDAFKALYEVNPW